MIRIFICSFQRTATTVLYKKLLETLRLPGLYEPFNYSVFYGSALKHDIEGYVKSDYHLIPKELYNLIVENSRWLLHWAKDTRPEVPFLGKYWKEILKSIDNLSTEFIVKDVFSWVYLKDIVSLLQNSLIIITVRKKKHVVKDLYSWYAQSTTLSRLVRSIRKVISGKAKVSRKSISNTIRYLAGKSTEFKTDPTIVVYYRYFFDSNYTLNNVKLKDVPKIIEKIYDIFLERVKQVENYDNVLVIKFEDRLDVDEVVERIVERYSRYR